MPKDPLVPTELSCAEEATASEKTQGDLKVTDPADGEAEMKRLLEKSSRKEP